MKWLMVDKFNRGQVDVLWMSEGGFSVQHIYKNNHRLQEPKGLEALTL